MKKTLIALSVLAAISGAAQAQSNVTVYGVLDMALQGENNGGNGAGKTFSLDSGVQSGSRLGFKGSEDLGNGLKANFKLEMGVNADTGASAQGGLAFGRAAWVGLSGNFGAVQLGRQNKPMFDAVDSIDPFSTGIIGGTAHQSTSATGLGNLFFATNPRSTNTINYTTTNLSGFTGSAAYTFGEAAGDATKGRGIGASGSYAAGPLYATVAYHAEDVAAVGVANNVIKHVFAGATYDFVVAKAAASYGKVSSDDNKTAYKLWSLGVTVPVSAAGAVVASVTGVKNDVVTTANKSTQLALGYTHSLSKRTNVYTSVSRVANDAGVNAGGLASGLGLTDSMVNVGIRHAF
ncbi:MULTISPECIES: porin [unclassified Undibacterium]|uniref:porin n=1 Tax=unclassified Undibacterium TaxID=2630295 RepID=UPI002AC90C42|nr:MULTISPECIES: porin [unclassified Undibacterium]MEB0138249.1 porin [Undibacterium sp. CCC2.1]MEB0171590.1 porin [Undibacterium sp. CCC1.1]MEB0175490.1 porin [Undibacterium sp. CCC3.4]MEB0214790.1 porin [Undibacterium sp. 5I2]WPX45277.1 porin [Undibacterium sp. CCC3.4]